MSRILLMLSAVLGMSLTLSAQVRYADGYRGIWYTLNQFSEYGDKYSGGLGTYTADHTPTAIYARKVDKTFFLYGATTKAEERHLQVCIGSYDHKKKTVQRPVIVCDKNGVDDPHDNGSLCMTPDGYIWVFVSGRNVTRKGQIFKSLKPYDINGFAEVYEGVFTYPQPYYIKGKGFILLFTRYTAPETRGRELYFSTSKDGKYWTEAVKIAAIEGHYQVSVQDGGRIFTAFNHHPGGSADTRTNLYVMQTDDMGKTWRNMHGDVLSVPLRSAANPALADDLKKDGKLLYLNDMNIDKYGNPVVLGIVSKHYQPGPQGGDREWTLYKYRNGIWHKQVVCTSTHNYDMGSLYIKGDEWRIVGPTEPGPQFYGTGGEMAVWESRDDGNSWKKIRLITKASTSNHSYARRPVNVNDGFYSFWADGHADKFTKSHIYFCDKKGEKLYRLPYDMTAMHIAPEIVVQHDKECKKNYAKPFGVNLAGAEFSEGSFPGVLGHDYVYPDTSQLDYYKSKGLNLIRLPFKWERIQPELNGPLEEAELQRLKNVIEMAAVRKMQIVLDMHNYVRRYVNGNKHVIGEGELKVEHFADVWMRIASEVSCYDNIYGLGLMNEPYDINKESVSWYEMAQKAVHAIRKTDCRHTIIIGGNHWSTAERWVEMSDLLRFIDDPCDNLMFEAHVYFDADGSGTYKTSYDESGCFPTRGVERVRPFVEWLHRYNLHGMIGEYGVPDDDERWLDVIDNMLKYLQTNGVNAVYWAGGCKWGKYRLSVHPENGADRPQMKIVEKYHYTK